MNMKFKISSLSSPLILLISLVITTSTPVSAQSENFGIVCLDDAGTYKPNSNFHDNLINHLLPSLSIQAGLSTFGDYTIGREGDIVNGLYNCRGDLSQQECHRCVDHAAKTIATKCPIEKEAILWYEECMLRYANRPIFSQEEELPLAWDNSKKNVSDPLLLRLVLVETFDVLIEQAAYNKTAKRFAVGEANVTAVESVYCYVQCTPDILGSECERCLRAALNSMVGCCEMKPTFVEVFLPSCQIVYDHAPFLGMARTRSDSPVMSPSPAIPQSPTPPGKGGSTALLMRSYWDLFMSRLMTMALTASLILLT